MPRRKLVNPREELISAGQEYVRSNPQTKSGYRASVVLFFLNGTPIETICASIKENRNTVGSWIKTADEKGFEALVPVKQEGRPSKLTDDQKQIVKKAVEADPNKEGYTVWQGATVSDFIKKKFNVSLKVRACQNLLKELGFALIRPQTFPNSGKDNAAEREAFKKNSADTV